MAPEIPRKVAADALPLSPGSTPGIQRFTAFDDETCWIGTARTTPGERSAWHLHPGHDTYVYAATGAVRIEFGPAGAEAVEARRGEFLKIPRGVVHREGNPSDDDAELVVVRVGAGPLVENVDGPDARA